MKGAGRYDDYILCRNSMLELSSRDQEQVDTDQACRLLRHNRNLDEGASGPRAEKFCICFVGGEKLEACCVAWFLSEASPVRIRWPAEGTFRLLSALRLSTPSQLDSTLHKNINTWVTFC